MDLMSQGRLIAEYYQKRYPEKSWIYDHVTKVLKAWHKHRNRVCHEKGFFKEQACHEVIAVRCKYIADFLEDFVGYLEPPRLDPNAPTAYDEVSLRIDRPISV
jgi:hypothetical protein